MRDNGVGLDTSVLQQDVLIDKFGLFSVRERLESLGGILRVMSTPGHGAIVICRLPLRAQPGPTEDLVEEDKRDRVSDTRGRQLSRRYPGYGTHHQTISRHLHYWTFCP